MAAVMRQPRAPRGRAVRTALVSAAACFAAVPFLCSRISFQASGPQASVAHSAPAAFVVASPSQLGAAGRSVQVARAAGGDQRPGGRPGYGQEVEEPQYKMVGEELEVQKDRVQRFAKFYKSVKGKHMPYGKKPWDLPRFKRVEIIVDLEAKQASNTKVLNQVIEEVRRISGAHPKIMKSQKNDNAKGFRIGDAAGVKVMLFGPLMYDFLERFNTLVLPRIRDFDGLEDNVGRRGDYWMEIADQDPFRELDELIDTRELTHGFRIGIINNCFTNPDGRKLMTDFGFPFNEKRKPYVRKILIETEGEKIARGFAEKRASR